MKPTNSSQSPQKKWLHQRATLSALYNLVDVPRFAEDILNLERIQVAGDWLRASCPFTENHRHGDRNRSFGIRMDGSGRYSCFVCGTGDIAGLVMKVLQKSFDEATDYIRDYVNAKPGELLKAILERKPSEKKVFTFDADRLAAVQGNVSRYVIQKRHVSLKIYQRFRLGYYAKDKMIYFPIYDFDGKLTGLITRPTYDKKYIFMEGTTAKSDWLYGIQYVPKNGLLYIVEGVFDCLRLWTLGYPAVATMGTSFSEKQGELAIDRNASVCYIRDNDSAGFNARNRAYDVIANRIPFYTTKIYAHRKDVGDMTDSEIHNLIKTRHLYLKKGGQ